MYVWISLINNHVTVVMISEDINNKSFVITYTKTFWALWFSRLLMRVFASYGIAQALSLVFATSLGPDHYDTINLSAICIEIIGRGAVGGAALAMAWEATALLAFYIAKSAGRCVKATT